MTLSVILNAKFGKNSDIAKKYLKRMELFINFAL